MRPLGEVFRRQLLEAVGRLGGRATALFALGSRRAAAQSTTLPTPPVVPLWQQWFDALNRGDVAAVRALMVTDDASGTVWRVAYTGAKAEDDRR